MDIHLDIERIVIRNMENIDKDLLLRSLQDSLKQTLTEMSLNHKTLKGVNLAQAHAKMTIPFDTNEGDFANSLASSLSHVIQQKGSTHKQYNNTGISATNKKKSPPNQKKSGGNRSNA